MHQKCSNILYANKQESAVFETNQIYVHLAGILLARIIPSSQKILHTHSVHYTSENYLVRV